MRGNASVDKLLAACCAVLTQRSDRVDWAEFTPAMWPTLAEFAEGHGIAPLVCQQFGLHGWPALMPLEIRAALQRGSYAATARSALLHAALEQIINGLHENGPLVLLKGAALGTTLYARPALRPMLDLDLLVPRRAVPRAIQALQPLGYCVTPEIAPGIHQQIEHHEHLQGGPHGAIGLDLHWNLVAGDADWRTPPIDWFWHNTEPWTPRHHAAPLPWVLQLNSTATLLYVSAHLMLQHCGAQGRLIWFYDLHLLLTERGATIDWDEFVQRAHDFGWAAAALAALHGARAYFDSPVPDNVLAALHAALDPRSTAFVQRKANAALTHSEWLNMLALQPAVRRRVLRRVLVPSLAYMRWRYQPRRRWLVVVCYVWHWARLIGTATTACASGLHDRMRGFQRWLVRSAGEA